MSAKALVRNDAGECSWPFPCETLYGFLELLTHYASDDAMPRRIWSTVPSCLLLPHNPAGTPDSSEGWEQALRAWPANAPDKIDPVELFRLDPSPDARVREYIVLFQPTVRRDGSGGFRSDDFSAFRVCFTPADPWLGVPGMRAWTARFMELVSADFEADLRKESYDASLHKWRMERRNIIVQPSVESAVLRRVAGRGGQWVLPVDQCVCRLAHDACTYSRYISGLHRTPAEMLCTYGLRTPGPTDVPASTIHGTGFRGTDRPDARGSTMHWLAWSMARRLPGHVVLVSRPDPPPNCVKQFGERHYLFVMPTRAWNVEGCRPTHAVQVVLRRGDRQRCTAVISCTLVRLVREIFDSGALEVFNQSDKLLEALIRLRSRGLDDDLLDLVAQRSIDYEPACDCTQPR